MKGKATQQQYQHSQQDPDATVATVATEGTTNASISSNSISTRISQSQTAIASRPRSESLSKSEKEKRLSTQIHSLVFISLVSAILFLLATFSLPSLFFFTVTVSTMALAGQASYQRLLIQINQRGLLYYLPESVQTYIRTTTLHEFMSDSTMFMEYRFLLLYFIPGLSEEQLMGFVNQLPEHRRQLLLSQGQVADIFLPASMRSRLYPISEAEDMMQFDDQMLLADRDDGGIHNSMRSQSVQEIPSDLVWETNEVEAMNDVHDMNEVNNIVNNANNHDKEDHVENNDDANDQGDDDVDDDTGDTVLPTQTSIINTNTGANIITNANTNTISHAIANAITNANSNMNTTSDWDLDGSALNNAISAAVRSYTREITTTISESLLSSVLSPSALLRSARLTGFLTFSTIAQWSWSWSSMMGHVHPARILNSVGYNGMARSMMIASGGGSESRIVGERSWRNLYGSNLEGRLLLTSTMFMGVSTGMMYFVRNSIRRSLERDQERRGSAPPSSRRCWGRSRRRRRSITT